MPRNEGSRKYQDQKTLENKTKCARGCPKNMEWLSTTTKFYKKLRKGKW